VVSPVTTDTGGQAQSSSPRSPSNSYQARGVVTGAWHRHCTAQQQRSSLCSLGAAAAVWCAPQPTAPAPSAGATEPVRRPSQSESKNSSKRAKVIIKREGPGSRGQEGPATPYVNSVQH